MTIEVAARQLAAMYREAPEREKASAHMFGMEYADQVDGMPAHDIAERAELPRPYGTEIRKGIRLARYVQLRDAA